MESWRTCLRLGCGEAEMAPHLAYSLVVTRARFCAEAFLGLESGGEGKPICLYSLTRRTPETLNPTR